MRVRVTSIGSVVPRVHEFELPELGAYLQSTQLRFRHEPETRVYTCRGPRTPYELHWGDHHVPGESFLGSYGLSVPDQIVDRIIAELMQGMAVRLFVYNHDSDLCFQEVLEGFEVTRNRRRWPWPWPFGPRRQEQR